jgi:transcriptional regulator
VTDESRTDRLLVIMLVQLMGDASQKDKAIALDKAGLTPAGIADVLDTTPASVSQQLYESRKARTTTKKAKAKSS